MDLQDIKNRIYKDENGISNYVDVAIDEMDWLVKQAEKVEVYEKELDRLYTERYADAKEKFPNGTVLRIKD